MLNTKPYPFQRDAACQIERFGGRCLLAMDMGTGKSITSLLWAYRNPEARPIIIVCPAGLKYNWQRECSTHFNWHAEVLEGMRPSKRQLAGKPHIVIVNYTILRPWMPGLLRLKPKLVIVDECHAIANRKTRQSQQVRILCQEVPHVLCLSGTPLVNRPAELWPTLHLIRPDLYDSFSTYAWRYCAPKRRFWGWDYGGSSNLRTLHKSLTRHLMVRKRKAEVLQDLPPKRRIVVPLEIENRSEYNQARIDLIGWLRKHSPSRARRAEKAQQLVKVGYLKRLAAKLKLKSLTEWLDQWLQDTDEKLIVFGVHLEVLQALHDKHKQQSVLVTGGVRGRDRQAAFDSFLKDPRTRLFIGQVRASGTGWSAKGVSNVAFAELDWTPGVMTQAEDRTHGIGRGKEGSHSTCYYLVARDTIEERLAEILEEKQGVLNAALDGSKKAGEQLDLFARLCRELIGSEGKSNGNHRAARRTQRAVPAGRRA